MADSLTPECTPLKTKYDSCFNSWFEGYLEPAVAHAKAANSSSNGATEEQRRAYSMAKAKEFEEKCGPVWNRYRECIHKAMKSKGLDKLLDQARVERPLKDPTTPPPIPTSS